MLYTQWSVNSEKKHCAATRIFADPQEEKWELYTVSILMSGLLTQTQEILLSSSFS